jgi:SAM-dependent methyltransferase
MIINYYLEDILLICLHILSNLIKQLKAFLFKELSKLFWIYFIYLSRMIFRDILISRQTRKVFNKLIANWGKEKTDVLDGLYHEYSFFGFENKQANDMFVWNQKAKAPIITAYTALAIAKASEIKESVSFVELFCADAYYFMVASRLGADEVYGVDNNKDEYADANKLKAIAKKLSVNNFSFVGADINKLSTERKYDIVANVGGLYHVTEPEKILEKSYELAKQYLIVQSVVSLANEDPDYFETPAPGWDWGCRYNLKSFDKMIRSKSYKIIDYHFNELEGNPRLEDRGSVYYLIEKE